MKRIFVLLTTAALMTAILVTGATVPGSAQTAGGFASPNVEYVDFLPFEQATSTGVTIQGKYMYLTSWKSISIYDISDPLAPVQTATLPVGFMFENEDVEITPDGSYLFFSEELPDDEFHVYNIEDKTSISEVAVLEGAGDHTFSCILGCTYGYGSDGTILDLRKPAEPKILAERTGDKNWQSQVGIVGGAHDVTEYKSGYALASPLDDTPVLMDVRDPANPKLVARGDGPVGWQGERGYLWHSGEWPRQGDDRWILMQGEDVLNPPTRSRCEETQGSFSIFDSNNLERSKVFNLTDTYTVEPGTYTDGSPAANPAFGCSAHWFEEHETFRNGGLITIAWYEAGTRFLQVTETGKINEVGHFLPYGGATSAAYWVTDKIVYAVDYQRGLDILRWTGKTYAPTTASGGGDGGGAAKLPGPLVRLTVSDRTPSKGSTVTFRTRLARCGGHENTNIQLRRRPNNNEKWQTVAEKKLDGECRATFQQKAGFDRAEFRTWWPKQHGDHRRGKSDGIVIQTN